MSMLSINLRDEDLSFLITFLDRGINGGSFVASGATTTELDHINTIIEVLEEQFIATKTQMCEIFLDTPATILIRNPEGQEFWLCKEAYTSFSPNARANLTIVYDVEESYEN